jgi:hypothetical protein
VDEVTCDDEGSVANKTKPGNQSLAVAVFVRLTGNTPQKGANNIAFARRTAIHLTGIMISRVGVKGQPFPLSPLLAHRIFPDDGPLGNNPLTRQPETDILPATFLVDNTVTNLVNYLCEVVRLAFRTLPQFFLVGCSHL